MKIKLTLKFLKLKYFIYYNYLQYTFIYYPKDVEGLKDWKKRNVFIVLSIKIEIKINYEGNKSIF